MIAHAYLTHLTQSGYETIKTEVNVIALTHEKSANKRAVIEYSYKGKTMRHYIPRCRLTYLLKTETL
jgi:hypothetical protein